MATKPNPKTIRAFLEHVVGSVPEGHYLCFWTLPARRSIWASKIDDELVATLTKEAEKADHVYMGVGLCRHDMGPTLRAKNDEISGIFGLWADLDFKGAGHKKTNLPPDEAAARELLVEMGATPTIVVRSGHGLQAYWLFREPWIFENDEERKAAASLSERWNKTLRLRAKAHGWDVDATHDLARVLRVPGTINRKTLPHVLADIVNSLPPDAHYDSNDFEERMLVDAEKADEKTANLPWKFSLNLQAEADSEKFALLCQYDPKFLETYKKNRPEWQDQSASSYDLALATRAFIAGWNEQEVVNLLIGFRRKHGGDPNKHQWDDYYRRTLNKAMSGKTAELRERYAADFLEGKALPEEVDNDPATKLEIASKLLSKNPGDIAITQVLKHIGSPNVYQFVINGKTLQVGTIKNIYKFSAFAEVVLDSDIKKTVKKPSADSWERILDLIIGCSQDVEAGPEATDHGRIRGYLREYLSSKALDEEQWNEALFNKVPVVKGDRVFFGFHQFRQYITKYQGEKIEVRKLSHELGTLDGHKNENALAYVDKKGKRSTRELRSVPKALLGI